VALELFARHGVAGTSLQAIADALGVTKAAVYHHHRTKAGIVLAVLRPAVNDLDAALADVSTVRDPIERALALVEHLADGVVRHRHCYAVLFRDVAVMPLVAEDPHVGATFDAVRDVLGAGRCDDPRVRARVALFLAGLLGPPLDPTLDDCPDTLVRDVVVEAGNHLVRGPRPLPAFLSNAEAEDARDRSTPID
jgi:AcrR family transcriptional regulator